MAADWLSYTGAITGVVGMCTGIAGAVMGYVRYRRSGKMKALDLRLELRKSTADFRMASKDLLALMEHAKDSRRAVSAATGQSGAFQKWIEDWENDFEDALALEGDLPPVDSDYAKAKHGELETRLVEVHTLGSRCARLRDKYQGAI